MAAMFETLTPAVSAGQVQAESRGGRRRKRRGKRGSRRGGGRRSRS